jgi:hypothetical protein
MAANPTTHAITANTWTKVATNVTEGWVHILGRSTRQYRHTYRLTGDAAPTDVDEGAIFTSNSEPISSTVGIDVYICTISRAGKVRVDL